MREPVIVINGFCERYQRRLEEMSGFFAGKAFENLIFLCRSDFSEDALKKLPARKVSVISCEVYDPQALLPVLEEKSGDTELIIFDSGYAGEELAVRLAYRKKGVSATKVKSYYEKDGRKYIEKSVYSNHMTGTFSVNKTPCCLSLAPGGVLGEILEPQTEPILEFCELSGTLQEYSVEKIPDEAGLEDTSFLVAAGRGAGSKEQVQEMEKIAKKIGADFGVSRPVAMSAWAPMDRLVGVSGALTKPKICIAVGASGAPAFYTGIEKSDFIVAVNTDEKAELLKKADVSIQGDCMEVMRELERMMEK